MSEPPGRIGAIVLAGGRSSRFGRDKLAEPIEGRRMLERAIDAVGQIATDIVVVAAPHSVPMVPAHVVLAHDARAYEGPLAGLATGLASLEPAIERAIVVGGDMPTLVPAVLDRLLDGLEARDLAVLADDAGPRPLPMAVRRSVAGPAAERLLAAGERRLRALLSEVDLAVIDPATWRADDPSGQSLRDVDVPDDLPG
jgi:molybdopterin-guanine dinucleotide biosynthesis protein A